MILRFLPNVGRYCNCHPERHWTRHIWPKWYWFYLAGLVGLMVRELVVVWELSGEQMPRLEITVAVVSCWLTLIFITSEVSSFSARRDSAPGAIDRVLDMVLLPLSYGFLCAVAVRVEVLQSGLGNHAMASATIECADIWEAWALWSVLQLFVEVVDARAKKMALDTKKEVTRAHKESQRLSGGGGGGALGLPSATNATTPLVQQSNEGGSPTSSRVSSAPSDVTEERENHAKHYLQVVLAFKHLSLSGVQAWVYSLVLANTLSIMVKGVIAPQYPTLCYWYYKSCKSCYQYYEDELYPIVYYIMFTLCCFAIAFVVAFERGFQEYLHVVQPYWKFWGVKVIVSVTYFQSTVISYLISSKSDQFVYNSLLCCVEMPLLAIFHSRCAYPNSGEWLEEMIKAAPKHWEKQNEFDEVDEDEENGNVEMSAPNPDGAPQAALVHSPTQAQALPVQVRSKRRCCLHFFGGTTVAIIVCGATTLFLLWAQPPQTDATSGNINMFSFMQIPNISCTFNSWDDVLRAGQARASSIVVPSGFASLRSVAYCDSVLFECASGYTGDPKFTCEPLAANFSLDGGCRPTKCPPPALHLAHSELNLSDSEILRDWHTNETVYYLCDQCYSGSPSRTCLANATWAALGEADCVPSNCTTPPSLAHAAIAGLNQSSCYTFGQAVSYQCDPGFIGNPTAICGASGRWRILGNESCKPLGCRNLEQFLDNRTDGQWRQTSDALGVNVSDAQDFVDGTVVSLRCKTGYQGDTVFATCMSQNWQMPEVCEPFTTSSGCSCRVGWNNCGGMLFWHSCSQQNGCMAGWPSWCQVEPNSCQDGSDRDTDYCVVDSAARAGLQKPGPNIVQWTVGTCGVLLLLGMGGLCFRHRAQLLQKLSERFSARQVGVQQRPARPEADNEF